MHLMLDLETWGTVPGCAVRSIGAAMFDPNDEPGTVKAEFYRNIQDRTSWWAGLKVDPSTAAWWDRQSAEARARFAEDPRPLAEVVDQFNKFWRENGATFAWCHGSGFDTMIWEAASRAVNYPAPWKFWNCRCTRTLYHAAGIDHRTFDRKGVHHDALDDAKHQVLCVQKTFRSLTDGVKKFLQEEAART